MNNQLEKLKFKKGDVVYIKPYLPFDYEIGVINGFDETKKMYVLIRCLDNMDFSFYVWTYVKEEDIDFAHKIFDIESVNEYREYYLSPKIQINNKNYMELYTDEFAFAKLVSEGKITKKDYFKFLDEYRKSEDYGVKK